MVHLDEKDLIGMIQQGVRGNAQGFALICRRVISSMKKRDPEVAGKLATLLSTESGTRGASSTPPPVDSDNRRQLLRETRNVVLETEPIWPPKTKDSLGQIVRERQAASRLIQAGLDPIKAVLFKGPPGVGKTLAAHWLGRELGLPVLTLDLATVMSSLLGKTGSNIKSVIDYARGFPCVLLLDEFDSVAKKRDDDRDVGELKRLVTVLLQSIDEWPSTSLLVAATNHPEILDPAVWRRFDVVMDFDRTTEESAYSVLASEGVSHAVARELAKPLAGLSYADLRKLTATAKKSSILDRAPYDAAIVSAAVPFIASKLESGADSHRDLQILQLALEGNSQRKIAEKIGVSHPTVGRVLKALKKETT